MRTAVITDTNSGITPEEAQRLGVYLVNMPILIDGETRFEGIDIANDEFFEILASGAPVSTSQPSPGDVCAVWKRALDRGYDEVAYIPMTAGLSNSFETARLASAAFDGKVQVVDNRRVSVTQRLTVEEAAAMAERGASALEIREALESRAELASIYLAVDSLEYLARGGRLTPAAAALGSLLKIKPVLTIKTEKIEPYSKERGMKRAISKMIEATRQDAERMVDPESDELIVGIATAGVPESRREGLMQEVQTAFPKVKIVSAHLPLSIAAHTGPGAMGIGMHIRPKEL